MAEQLGDGAQRGPAHHQPGRERVPQAVPGEVFDLGQLQSGVESVLDVLPHQQSVPLDVRHGERRMMYTGSSDLAACCADSRRYEPFLTRSSLTS
jgi:hypothetical protein